MFSALSTTMTTNPAMAAPVSSTTPLRQNFSFRSSYFVSSMKSRWNMLHQRHNFATYLAISSTIFYLCIEQVKAFTATHSTGAVISNLVQASSMAASAWGSRLQQQKQRSSSSSPTTTFVAVPSTTARCTSPAASTAAQGRTMKTSTSLSVASWSNSMTDLASSAWNGATTGFASSTGSGSASSDNSFFNSFKSFGSFYSVVDARLTTKKYDDLASEDDDMMMSSISSIRPSSSFFFSSRSDSSNRWPSMSDLESNDSFSSKYYQARNGILSTGGGLNTLPMAANEEVISREPSTDYQQDQEKRRQPIRALRRVAGRAISGGLNIIVRGGGGGAGIGSNNRSSTPSSDSANLI